MQKKRNAKKGAKKKTSKKQRGMLRSGLSGSFQIIGISLLFGCGLFALVSALEKISTSSAFQVENIKWLGLQSLKEGEILKHYRAVVGQNIFKVDIEAVHRHLLSNPRIKAATVKKDFPNRLLIIVEEKQPAAARFEINENTEEHRSPVASVVIMDAEGSVLQRDVEMQGLASLPTGLPRLLHFREDAYAKALDLGQVLKNRQDLYIDLTDPEDLLVYFAAEKGEKALSLLHIGGTHFRDRWDRFLAIEDDLKARGLLHWEIDLRFPGQAIVKNGALYQRPPVLGRRSDTTYF